MTLQEQNLAYICRLCQIELLGEYSLMQIAEECKGFDMEEFTKFVKERIEDYSLKYIPKGDRTFNKLCKMYNLERNAERIEKANSEAYILAEKFRGIKSELKREFQKNIEVRFENLLKKGTIEAYFTKFEENTLKRIGTLKQITAYDDNMELEERIQKEFMRSILPQNQVKQVENKKLQIGNRITLPIKKM